MKVLSCLLVLAACGRSRPADMGPDAEAPLDDWGTLCAKHYGDRISRNFCDGGYRPAIDSLAGLEQLLGIYLQTAKVSLTTESTGVGIRSITPLNPRAVLMREDPDAQIGPFEVLSFARGEPLVELVGDDQAADTLRFFVVQFHPACEATPEGCNPGNLLIPAIEENWTSYTIYDEDALANTPLDCNTCHQPDGPGTRKIMRMQERPADWVHWIGGRANIQAFQKAHEHEPTYAGFPVDDELSTSPFDLEHFLESHGYSVEPNMFDSGVIDGELAGSGSSATWQGLYENAVTGQAIPPPYFGPDPTDPTRLAAFVDSYLAVTSGTAPPSSLPDPRTVLSDAALPWMSIRPKPGLDGRGILVHMCSQCHNSRLDQTLSRARFNVMTLDAMSRQEKDLAIARLQLPDDDPAKMPPPRFRTLSDAERGLVIDELSR